ncbi:aminotransferase class IV [Alkalicoccus urumqiensis]|uniref:4-amino-4-deoxychorismate lyase n=1 Tax=Alkalicoccus urumqiensis TaxID=1548213 RepID=A0A2P6MDP2_ALKUR|nr:aminotransferase class IV [Alkalicoccus urumqiensis]PRO64411.1 4-amino-4-deoxychorismate lyase [Alkalicoccus urumqiensis]
MYLLVNDEIRHSREAFLSPYEHGFLYGAGVFETFRTYNGRPFLLEDHLDRMREGAEEFGIEFPESRMAGIRENISRLLEVNGLSDGYFRLNLSGGDEGVGLPEGMYTEPLLLLYVKPLPEKMKPEKTAATLRLRRSTPEGTVRRKSHHYGNNILAKRELKEHGTDEGIFLDAAGAVSESITSNVLLYKDGALYLPDNSCGCLPGVTAHYTASLAREAGLRVFTGRFSEASALHAEEVLLTNSIQEIVPVSSWNGRRFPGKDGKAAQVLRALYREGVNRTIRVISS